jgi:hypothetical protein
MFFALRSRKQTPDAKSKKNGIRIRTTGTRTRTRTRTRTSVCVCVWVCVCVCVGDPHKRSRFVVLIKYKDTALYPRFFPITRARLGLPGARHQTPARARTRSLRHHQALTTTNHKNTVHASSSLQKRRIDCFIKTITRIPPPPIFFSTNNRPPFLCQCQCVITPASGLLPPLSSSQKIPPQDKTRWS